MTTMQENKVKASKLIKEAMLYMPEDQFIMLQDDHQFGKNHKEFFRPLYFFVNGLFFGYPVCCIIFFIWRWYYSDEKWERHLKDREVDAMLGHIPCDYHYKKALAKK